MPIITLNFIDRDQAFNNIIASIALQEAALSHILNADSEKLQTAVNLVSSVNSLTLPNLLEINDSVTKLIESVSNIEDLLREKLGCVLDFIQTEADLLPDSAPVYIVKVNAATLGNAFNTITYDEALNLGTTAPSALLPGAVFSADGKYAMRDDNGYQNGYMSVIRQGETDDMGRVVLDLPYRHGGGGAAMQYLISEIIAPDGFSSSSTPFSVKVSQLGEVTADTGNAPGVSRWIKSAANGDPPILLVGNQAETAA